MTENNYNYWWEAAKILAPFIAAGLATYVSFLRLKKENQIYIQRLKYESILNAHKSVWELASFMGEIENNNSIITWKENLGNKTYTFHPERAKMFMDKLREIYFDKGHGAFLSRKTTDCLYEFRGKIFGLLLAKNNPTEPFEMIKAELATSLFKTGNDLRIEIRNAIELSERRIRLE